MTPPTPLVSLTAPAFDVDIALAYATPDNITGKAIYARAEAQLHPAAAAALQRACALAAPLGLRFRIFDAFRPVEAQWRLWEAFPDPEFVADPRSGSCHSRGVAVDLTLIDAAGGAALDMGTPFDDFTALSHQGRRDLPAQVQRNRALLLGIMTAAGWDWIQSEWWHYQLFEPRRYPLLADAAAPHQLMDG
ncbi:MAG: D-alanyl-D-alanine dipeptidase [Kiloniellaceae bacterium]